MLFKIISSRPQFLLKFLFVNKCRNTHRCVCIDHLCNVFQQIYYSYFFQNSNYNVHSIDMIRIQQMNASIYFRICIWMLMQNDTSNSLVKYNILINVETMFPSHIYDTSNEMQNMGLFFAFFYYAYNDECFFKDPYFQEAIVIFNEIQEPIVNSNGLHNPQHFYDATQCFQITYNKWKNGLVMVIKCNDSLVPITHIMQHKREARNFREISKGLHQS